MYSSAGFVCKIIRFRLADHDGTISEGEIGHVDICEHILVMISKTPTDSGRSRYSITIGKCDRCSAGNLISPYITCTAVRRRVEILRARKRVRARDDACPIYETITTSSRINMIFELISMTMFDSGCSSSNRPPAHTQRTAK
jgi:hypothetical protein